MRGALNPKPLKQPGQLECSNAVTRLLVDVSAVLRGDIRCIWPLN